MRSASMILPTPVQDNVFTYKSTGIAEHPPEMQDFWGWWYIVVQQRRNPAS